MGPDHRFRFGMLRLAETALWVGTVSAAVVIVLAVPSFLFGDGLLTLKYALFVVGFVLFGFGSLAIQPVRPRQDGTLVDTDGDTEYGFEERIGSVLPTERRLTLEDRVSRNTKLFVASLVVLAVSYLLESGFGVAA
jgi:hypothetical protein